MEPPHTDDTATGKLSFFMIFLQLYVRNILHPYMYIVAAVESPLEHGSRIDDTVTGKLSFLYNILQLFIVCK